MDEAVRTKLHHAIQNNAVVVFMKGTRRAPQCGFSARVVEALDALLPEYTTIDVLADAATRDGIKEYSAWPTIPQLYVRGEFVGGCDIVSELYASGELAKKLGVVPAPLAAPELELSDAAAAELKQAATGDEWIHLEINAAFENELTLAPPGPNDLRLEIKGVRFAMSPATARRAQGLVIEFVQTADGGAFRLDNPNEPPKVRPMTVLELSAKLKSGEALEFFDVRPEGERALASIAGARMLDEAAQDHIATLPKDTTLIFHCHHGGRSQSAAQHFVGLGFRRVYNVIGGVDAWSVEVDPSVPRY